MSSDPFFSFQNEDMYGRSDYASNTSPRHLRSALCPCQVILIFLTSFFLNYIFSYSNTATKTTFFEAKYSIIQNIFSLILVH